MNMKTMGIVLALALGGVQAGESLKNADFPDAKPAPYQRRGERTAIFSRAQLKYGWERSDYYHKWIDRPLLANPEFAASGGGWLNRDAFSAMSRVVRECGLDGFAFFPETANRAALYDACRRPGDEMAILTEFLYTSASISDPKDIKEKLKYAKMALDNSRSHRICGKVVITSYPWSDDGPYWRTLKKALTDAYGDHFLILPYYRFFPEKYKPGGPGGVHTAGDIAMLRERLREWLRHVDGVYYNTPARLKNRRYDAEFDRTFILPIIHGVLAEEEFQQKYLAWGTKVGHENYGRGIVSFDPAGTDMLRGTMETALLARPDIINCVEWDEQNENTSFAPTVYNSFSTQRILRHYSDILAGRPLSPMAGDDAAIPNLILSYRKIVVAGEPLEFEVAGVPDNATAPDTRFSLQLRDLAGEVAHRFPEQTLKGGALDAVRLTAPAEDMLKHQVLLPELIVGGRSFAEGFQPIELRASWNWDFKWVKQPLRDLIPGAASTLSVAETLPDGTLRLEATLAASEELAVVEVLDGGDVVYAHRDGDAWREDGDTVVLNVNFQANSTSMRTDSGVLNGVIRWRGMPSLRHRAAVEANPAVEADLAAQSKRKTEQAMVFTGNEWRFNNLPVNKLARHLYAAINRDEAAQGVLEIDLPGIHQGELAVADILAREAVAFPAPGAFNLVFRRYNAQIDIPPPIQRDRVAFTCYVRPSSANSLLHLQAIARSGRTYRGSPVSLYRPSGQTAPLAVYSRTHGRRVEIPADRRLLTSIEYEFSPERGAVLSSGAGREFLALGGGWAPQVTGRGSGESAYGTPLPNPIMVALIKNNMAAPVWEREDGRWHLRFAPPAFVAMPRALTPTFSAFEMEVELRPDTIDGVQTVVGNYPMGFLLTLNQGVPTASLYHDNHHEAGRPPLVAATGPALAAGAWARVVVRADQETLTVLVDGVAGAAQPSCGYRQYSPPFGLGVNSFAKDPARFKFFRGAVRRLAVRHFSGESGDPPRATP